MRGCRPLKAPTERAEKDEMASWRKKVAAALGLLLVLQGGPVVAQAATTVRRPAQLVPGAFTDGFAQLPRQRAFSDGARMGGWKVTFAGYGSVRTEQEGATTTLALRPKAATSVDETHGALVQTEQSFGDHDVRLRVKTVSQLRTGSTPNPWETAWVLWHYSDNTHFYSFVLKTNGWELGKEDPAYPGAQRFIATGDDVAFAPGTWHDVHVRQVGAHITVEVDGRQLASVTDTERPYLRGALALYDEDAHTRFAGVTVTPAR